MRKAPKKRNIARFQCSRLVGHWNKLYVLRIVVQIGHLSTQQLDKQTALKIVFAFHLWRARCVKQRPVQSHLILIPARISATKRCCANNKVLHKKNWQEKTGISTILIDFVQISTIAGWHDIQEQRQHIQHFGRNIDDWNIFNWNLRDIILSSNFKGKSETLWFSALKMMPVKKECLDARKDVAESALTMNARKINVTHRYTITDEWKLEKNLMKNCNILEN